MSLIVYAMLVAEIDINTLCIMTRVRINLFRKERKEEKLKCEKETAMRITFVMLLFWIKSPKTLTVLAVASKRLFQETAEILLTRLAFGVKGRLVFTLQSAF